MDTLGIRIREARQRFGMTQKVLADLADISTTAMNDIEKGHTRDPRFSVVCRIAEALNMSLDQLRCIQSPPAAIAAVTGAGEVRA